MPHDDDLAVVFCEFRESRQESLLKFATNCCRRRGQFVIAQLSSKIQRRLVRIRGIQ